jgi:hypothetical protein
MFQKENKTMNNVQKRNNCARNRKVAGSITNGVFFNWPNPSSPTMTLGLLSL